MPPGESPAVARRRVRLALRAARESLGLTQGQVAEAMEWSLSKIMRIESGDVTITPIDLRALLACLEVTESATVQRLIEDAKVARRRKSWWFDSTYREHLPSGLLRLIQFEAEATALRHFNIMVIPGLLQTPTYASAILGNYDGEVSSRDLEVRHEVRMRRQQEFFSRSDRPTLMVLLDESVLYREVGGPEVLSQQLKALVQRADRDRTWIRVVPFTAAAPIALIGPFALVELGNEDNSLLYREGPLTDGVIDDAGEVRWHRRQFEQLWSLALDDEASIALIAKRAKVLSSGRHRNSRP